MRTKNIILVLLGLLVGSALLALAPAADAQSSGAITITLTKPEVVKPLQGTVEAIATVDLSADYSGGAELVGIPVQFTVQGPAWATVTPNPASAVFQPPAPGTDTSTSYKQSVTVKISISASDAAPAFNPQPLTITAITKPTSATGKPLNGVGATVVEAGYFSIIDVAVQNAIVVERPQTTLQVPVSINNLGNAQTKVTFEIGEGSTIGDVQNALKPSLPPPATLGSKQAGAAVTKQDILLDVQTPYKNGYMNEVGVLNYKITSAYALNNAFKGDDSQFSVLITTRGFYVPGPSPILFLGLVGVLALALRRFRDA